MNAFKYVGEELDIFEQAHCWKSYWSSVISRYLTGDVLEVGAGVGANVPYLIKPAVRSLTFLEPDGNLLARLRSRSPASDSDVPSQCVQGTLEAIHPTKRFHAIVYVDVLEHIEDDHSEVQRAETFLSPAGHLIIIGPAHEFLYSEFDRSIGHYRRYTRESIIRLTPAHSDLVDFRYLDSIGLMASLANALLMRQALPTAKQIRFWDRVLVRLSRLADPLLRYSIGKSALAVWRRRQPENIPDY